MRGISALVLGGSRARGSAVAGSDYDVGIYYEPNVPLAVDELRAGLVPLADEPAKLTVTDAGAWGPWINGGASLRADGQKIDVFYRDLSRVRAVIVDCIAGVTEMHYEPGHPHGFCSAVWMGEVALGLLLRDDANALARLKKRTQPYPERLAQALIARFHWEVLLSIQNAESAANRGDRTAIAGCVYRALACIAQVMFAVNRRYLVSEKGAFTEAASFANPIPRAKESADRIWGALGRSDFDLAVRLLRTVHAELDALVGEHRA